MLFKLAYLDRKFDKLWFFKITRFFNCTRKLLKLSVSFSVFSSIENKIEKIVVKNCL